MFILEQKIPDINVMDPKRMYGTNAVDYDIRTDFDSLRKKRTNRAIEMMKKHGLGALLCFTGSKIRYVSGTYAALSKGDALMLYRYCVLTEDGPVLFETPGTDFICAKKAAPWVTDIRPAQVWKTGAGTAKSMMTKKFAQSVIQVLEEHGVRKEKLGVDEVGAWSAYKALMDEGVEVVDGTPALDDAVIIKFQEELEILKQACAIADAGFDTIERRLRPGIRENELCGACANTLYSLGSEGFVHMTFASGGDTNPFRRWGPTDKIIRYGDMVIIDLIHRYNGYWTCFYRNFVCGGKPTKEQKQLHQETYDSVYAAIRKIRPGAKTSEIAEVWREKESWESQDSKLKTVSLMQFGHGVGTWDHEPPYITLAYSPEHPVEIRKNMYLAIETYAGKWGQREGARLEENMAVTDNGVEIYSMYPFPDYFFE